MPAQLAQALHNLEAVLGVAGLDELLTTDVDAFSKGFKVVATWLGESGARVASGVLGVAGLAFPQLLVEIEATGVA